MIGSRLQTVDFGEFLEPKSLPVYTDEANLKIYSKPEWLEVSVSGTYYETGDSLAVTGGKQIFTLSITEGRFSPVYNDTLIISNVSGSTQLPISVLWSFEPEKRSLNQIADSLEIDLQDTPLSGLHRIKVLKKLKEGLSQLGFTGMREVHRFEAQRNSASVVFQPIDMVKFLRMYAVDEYGRLGLMYETDKINKNGTAPVTDEDDYVVMDNNGVWVEASGLTPSPSSESPTYQTENWLYESDVYGNPNWLWSTSRKGDSGGQKSYWGEYIYDKSQKGWFIQDCPYDDFLIEYVSDPNLKKNLNKDYGNIRIHQDWAEALKSWTFYELVKWRSDVAQSEKERARVEMGLARKNAKKLTLDWSELIQALRSKSNIHKG